MRLERVPAENAKTEVSGLRMHDYGSYLAFVLPLRSSYGCKKKGDASSRVARVAREF